MHLEKKNLKVQDLEKDFSGGVKLIALLEILHGKKIEGRYYKNPKSKPYMIDNVNFALNMITDVFGVKLIQCSAEDIVDGNTKIILGMLWRLINRFQLSADNSRTWLLNWCAEVTSSYEKVNITNFHSSFQDGLAFCALLHYYDKTFLDFDSLDSDDGIRNVRLAFNIAEEQLEIPQLLDPSDITKGLADERSVMTYLSMIKKAFDHRTTGGVVKMKQDFSIAPVEAATPVTESTKEPTEIVRIESSPQDQEKIQQLTVQNHQLKEEIVSLNKEITTLKETNQNLLQTNETLRAQITTEMENDSEDSEDSVPVPAVSSRAIPAIV